MATPKEEDYGVYDPLPALADLPGGDQRFYNDMYNDSGVPQEVAADAAGMPAMSEAPAIPETGRRRSLSWDSARGSKSCRTQCKTLSSRRSSQSAAPR